MGSPLSRIAVIVRGNDPYSAFRVRDYRHYMIGWIIYLVGMRIQSVAIGWETY